MLERIIECVPNFSEGRNLSIINSIADAIREVDGVRLLDIDSGYDANRTVYTFVGSPESVAEAAFRAVAKSAELIDMTKHHGEHPRIGACDVMPFIPVSGITMEETVEIARGVAKGWERSYLFLSIVMKPLPFRLRDATWLIADLVNMRDCHPNLLILSGNPIMVLHLLMLKVAFRLLVQEIFW